MTSQMVEKFDFSGSMYKKSFLKHEGKEVLC